LANKYALAALLLAAIPAHAGIYLDLGLSVQDGCITDYDESNRKPGCSNNPFGLVAVGYRWEDLMVEVEHRSSLVEKDQGINAATIKYRLEWK